jgi:hypothetical protein
MKLNRIVAIIIAGISVIAKLGADFFYLIKRNISLKAN